MAPGAEPRQLPQALKLLFRFVTVCFRFSTLHCHLYTIMSRQRGGGEGSEGAVQPICKRSLSASFTPNRMLW